MLTAICLALALATTSDRAEILPEILAGSWWVKGNESYGGLDIQVSETGAIRGTVFDQPIEGTFDPKTGKLAFTRMLPGKERNQIQEWSGKLTGIANSRPPAYKLEGTFKSLAGDEFGKAGVDYAWSSTAIRHPAPAVDLRDLQGEWKVSDITDPTDVEDKLPAELGFDQKTTALEIKNNQLVFQGKPVATLANDLNLKPLEKEIGFRDYRLVCLTLPNGKGLMCSYLIQSEGVEICFPHTTFCHRGSGHCVMLKRAK